MVEGGFQGRHVAFVRREDDGLKRDRHSSATNRSALAQQVGDCADKNRKQNRNRKCDCNPRHHDQTTQATGCCNSPAGRGRTVRLAGPLVDPQVNGCRSAAIAAQLSPVDAGSNGSECEKGKERNYHGSHGGIGA